MVLAAYSPISHNIKSFKGDQKSKASLLMGGTEDKEENSIHILNGETNVMCVYAIKNFHEFIRDIGGKVDPSDDIGDLSSATKEIIRNKEFIEEILQLMDSSPAAVKIFEATDKSYYGNVILNKFPEYWYGMATHPANTLSLDLDSLGISSEKYSEFDDFII